MLSGDQWRIWELTNVDSDVTEPGDATLSLVTFLRAVRKQVVGYGWSGEERGEEGGEKNEENKKKLTG